MASPSPLPRESWVLKKRSKTCGRSSREMPGPVSLTDTITLVPSAVRAMLHRTRISPPRGV